MRVRDANDQPASLKVTTVRDQHGRRYDVTLDRETLVHIGTPIPKFRAPLDPPAQYLKTDGDRLGRLKVDYDAWEAEWEAAERTFQDRLLFIRRSEKDPDVVREMAGQMPQSVEFVRAARAGNRWVLGIPHPEPGKRYTCPPELEPLLDRIGPRPTRAADLAARTASDRRKYADAEEAIPEWMASETADPDVFEDPAEDTRDPSDEDDARSIGAEDEDEDLELDEDDEDTAAQTATKTVTVKAPAKRAAKRGG
jgi:hypothetical protein